MPEHIWSILCTKTSIDKDTNNISIFDVIERISIAGAPSEENVALAVQAELAILWARSDHSIPETAVGRLRLVAPDGAVLGTTGFEINLGEPHVRLRTVMRISSLPLRGPGIYNFVVEVQAPEDQRWRPVSSTPLEVSFGDGS